MDSTTNKTKIEAGQLTKIVPGLTESQLHTQTDIIKTTTDNEFRKMSDNFDFYEKVFMGQQWDMFDKGIKKFTSSGQEVWLFKESKKWSSKKPKRTVNKIFPLLLTEAALFLLLNPTVVATPKSNKVKTVYNDVAKKLNLFLSHIFNDEFQKESIKSTLEILQFGQSPICIYYDPKKNKTKDIPFYLKKDDVRNVRGDFSVDSWANIKWAIRDLAMYRYEVESQFEIDDKEIFTIGNEDKKDFTIEKLTEYWIKGEALSNECDPDLWYQIIELNSKFLIKKGNKEIFVKYPVCPLEVVRMYIPPVKGWQGISEIDNIWEQQKIINKRASQEDFHITYNADPACAVDQSVVKNVNAEDDEVLTPGKLFAQGKNPNIRSVDPILVTQIPAQTFTASKQEAESDMRNITGIEDAAQGNRGTGVYSAKLFNELQSSIQTRLDLKKFFIADSYVSIAKKLIEWAKEDLGANGNYTLYDPDEDVTIVITKSDFEQIEKFDIQFQTIDANLLSRPERLNKLSELKQYNPDIPTSQIVLATESVYPGFFDKDFVSQVMTQDAIQKATNENNLMQAEIQKAQLIQQGNTLAQQATNPQPTPQMNPQTIPQGTLPSDIPVQNGIGG